jgi:8-oxo-dGTP pyrophosphatase MutT (NUDIX family)
VAPDSETPRRRAARVVILGPAGAVLLISGRDPSQPEAPTFWFAPGGGAEEGEDLQDAARREVFEETGATLAELGPVVWRRHTSFGFDGCWFDQDESFFVVRAEHFLPAPTALTELEQRATTGARWWPLDELSSSTETVYPPRLAQLIAQWLSSGPCSAPVPID